MILLFVLNFVYIYTTIKVQLIYILILNNEIVLIVKYKFIIMNYYLFKFKLNNVIIIIIIFMKLLLKIMLNQCNIYNTYLC